MDPSTLPRFVDAPVQGLHYRPVGDLDDPDSPKTSQETDGRGGFNPGKFGTVAFAVGEIAIDGDGLTLSQYTSNGLLGFIVHPAGEWQYGVFTPYDLRDAEGNEVNVGAIARVLQGFDESRPTTSDDGINIDDDLILIHPGATTDRKVIFDPTDSAGEFSVQENKPVTVTVDVGVNKDDYTIAISLTDDYGGATLEFPTHENAMKKLSMVISVMANEIAPFAPNSKITLNSREARTSNFARRGAYSLISGGLTNITIDSNTGSISIAVTSGEPPENVSVVFQYGDQISLNQAVELNALPGLKTDAKAFQIYFTEGKPVSLALTVAKGGNLPLLYELTLAMPPRTELRQYGLYFDGKNGILSGTPRSAFTVNVDLDVFDSGKDDVNPIAPDLQFQIVSREGEPAYYEIDLTGGAGSTATLTFDKRDGNESPQDDTEESIAAIDSNCQDPAGELDDTLSICPYRASYIYGGERQLGVTVMVGLKSIMPGDNTICAGNGGICPAGVKMFTIHFRRDLNDNEPLSVTVRVLLPRPAFDPAFADEAFATYIQGSPNPSRRPLPAADGGNGRLIYSLEPTDGLTFNPVTRRLLERPTVSVSSDMPFPLTMTVADGDGDSTAYPFTIVVQPDRMPTFAIDAKTAFTATLTVASTFTLPEADNANRKITYFVSDSDTPPGMTFDSITRQLSGSPSEVDSFTIDYIATDPDEERDENGDLHPDDDDKITLTIVVFVDGVPSFGDQTVLDQSYIANSQIAALTLPEATGGNGALTYTLSIDSRTDLAGLLFNDNSRVLSGTPTQAGDFTFRLTVTDSDDENPDPAVLSFAVNIVGDAAPSFSGTSFVDQNYIETWPITPVFLPEVTSDGNGETTYSIEGLPSGLNFDRETRELSGAPTENGIFPITLVASDSDLNTSDIGKLEFDIIVAPDIDPVLSDSVADQDDYIQNTRITDLTLPEANSDSGNGALTYSLAPLPRGLSFNLNTRILSGRPEEAGVFQLTYRVTDSDPVDPDSDTDIFVLTIAPDLVPSFAESVPQQNYFQGEAITMTVLPEARGGNGAPLTYADSGLPAGIVFDRASRQLRGAPTGFGSFVATIVARDTDGNTDESDNGVLTFGISVEADTQPSFGSLTVSNQTYTLSVRVSPLRLPAATGGNGQLIYSVSDDLPPGLAFNDNTQTDNTRIINLTPTTAGTYTVVYTVEDGDGDTRSLTFTITVVAS